MVPSEIEAYDATGKRAEEREDFGVMRGAGRGDPRDNQQNDSDDNPTEDRPDGGLQLPNTTLYISIPLARAAWQPFRRGDFFLYEGERTFPRLFRTRIAAIPIVPVRAGACPITVATIDSHRASLGQGRDSAFASSAVVVERRRSRLGVPAEVLHVIQHLRG